MATATRRRANARPGLSAHPCPGPVRWRCSTRICGKKATAETVGTQKPAIGAARQRFVLIKPHCGAESGVAGTNGTQLARCQKTGGGTSTCSVARSRCVSPTICHLKQFACPAKNCWLESSQLILSQRLRHNTTGRYDRASRRATPLISAILPCPKTFRVPGSSSENQLGIHQSPLCRYCTPSHSTD